MPRTEQSISGSDILALVYNVLAGRNGAEYFYGGIVCGLSALDHHNGVGVVGEHPASVGDGSLAYAERNVWAGSGGDIGDDLQHRRQGLGRAEGVAGAD